MADTTSSSTSTSTRTKRRVVKLNIGGYKYVTTKETLLGANLPNSNASSTYGNYFAALLDGKFESTMLDYFYFIDRDGQYFSPLLEYLRTGDVEIPEHMSVSSVVREAEFYGIKYPLCESSPSLSFINDEWLARVKANEGLSQIHTVADPLLELVLNDFKQCASQGKPVQSRIFMREVAEDHVGDFAANLARLAKRQHETQDIKTAVLSEVNKACKECEDAHVDNDIFGCLEIEQNQDVLIHFCAKQNLTVSIAPKIVKINWKGTASNFVAGFFFVHGGLKQRKKSRTPSQLYNV